LWQSQVNWCVKLVRHTGLRHSGIYLKGPEHRKKKCKKQGSFLVSQDNSLPAFAQRTRVDEKETCVISCAIDIVPKQSQNYIEPHSKLEGGRGTEQKWSIKIQN
jgi:hypothetical protein